MNQKFKEIALSKILKKIGHQRLSEKECLQFLEKLQAKGSGEQDKANEIEAILVKLHEWKYINDVELIEDYLRLFMRKQWSPLKIKMKLNEKFSEILVSEVLLKIPENYEKDALLFQLDKSRRIGNLKKRDNFIASLLRKGFSKSLVFDIIHTRIIE